MATNDVRSDSWRRTSSFEAPLERAVVERPRDPQGRGDVEGGLPGRELIEEPQGLLREGERQRTDLVRLARSGWPRAGRRRDASPRSARPVRRPWEPRRGRGAGSPRRTLRGAARRPGSPGVSGRRCRRSCHGRRRDRGPRQSPRRTPPPPRPARGAPRRARPAAPGLAQEQAGPLGRPCRWASAGGPPAPRMPTGSSARGASSSRIGVAPSWPGPADRPRPSDRRPSRRSSGASSRATTAASRTAGCRASASSISPGSIRKPRTLTWRSTRPRYSRLPSGRQRARSPVR